MVWIPFDRHPQHTWDVLVSIRVSPSFLYVLPQSALILRVRIKQVSRSGFLSTHRDLIQPCSSLYLPFYSPLLPFPTAKPRFRVPNVKLRFIHQPGGKYHLVGGLLAEMWIAGQREHWPLAHWTVAYDHPPRSCRGTVVVAVYWLNLR